MNADFSITNGQYKDSKFRKDAFSADLQLGASYLEQWGVNFRAGTSTFAFNNKSDSIEQNEYGVRFFKNIYSDSASGVITLILGKYWINGDKIDPTTVYNPELTFLNHSKSLLLGLGYANSKYGENRNTALFVNQYSATLGFKLLFNNLWMNIKGMLINYGNNPFYSAQPTLSWLITNKNRLYPSTLSFGGLLGKRSYAVEQERMLTYNISDVQQYSYFTSVLWHLSDNRYFSISAGSETLKDSTSNTNYQYNYINGGLSIIW